MLRCRPRQMSATTLLCKADFLVEIDALLLCDQPGGLWTGYQNGVSPVV